LIGILVLTFAFVLMPFLLWYMTTFSRPLTDAELGTYFTTQRIPAGRSTPFRKSLTAS